MIDWFCYHSNKTHVFTHKALHTSTANIISELSLSVRGDGEQYLCWQVDKTTIDLPHMQHQLRDLALQLSYDQSNAGLSEYLDS